MTIKRSLIVYPFYCFGSLEPFLKLNVKEFSIHVFHCSVIKVPVSFWQLWYFIISFRACQELFLFFIEVFFFCRMLSFLRHPYQIITSFLTYQQLFNFFQNIRKFHFQYFKTQLPVVSISLLQQLAHLITGSAVCQQLFS